MMKKNLLLTVSAVMLLCMTRAFAYAGEPADSTLRFAFLTDTHLAENTGAIEDLAACLKDVNRNDSLDFVLSEVILPISELTRKSHWPRA